MTVLTPATDDGSAQIAPVAVGLVRGTVVALRLYGPVSGDVAVVARMTDGRRVALAAAELRPGHGRALRALHEALSPRIRRRLRRLEPRTDLAFALPEGLVVGLEAALADGAPIVWAGADGGLEQLLPLDEETFRAALSFGTRRHADAETVRFITGQVLRGPGVAATADGFEAGYLINAFVIHLYKSIELDRHDPADQTDAVFERMNGLLAAMPTTGIGVRSDVEQLFVSMRMALWQAHMGRGDVDRATQRLNEIVAYHDLALDRPLNCNRSYNLAKSVFMAGLLALARDDKPLAFRLFQDAFNVFRRGVAAVTARTSNLTWFAEMAATHQVAINAMTLVQRLARGVPIPLEVALEMAPSAVRVEGEAYVEALQATLRGVWVEPRVLDFKPPPMSKPDLMAAGID